MNLPGVLLLLVTLCFSVIGLFIKCIRWFALGLLLISVGFIILRYKMEERWTKAFDSIPESASYESVIAIAGTPTTVSKSPNGPYGYSLIQKHPEIVREAWYISFFAPEQYVFGFGKDGKLLDRYRYSSP